MLYRDIEKVIVKINDDISEITVYENEESFINSKFQMFLSNGEYGDNSMDLAYHYNMLKSIENDEEFIRKLKFILNKYIHSKTFSLLSR